MTDASDVSDQPIGATGDTRDDGLVEEIVRLLISPKPSSFFLFAGAGSGKTHTLKEVLIRLTGRVEAHAPGRDFAQRLSRDRRQIAVITYTNNATDEIERRLASNPLVVVSTIHTFCWRLMEGFDVDIRSALMAGVCGAIAKKEGDPPGETTKTGRKRRADDLFRMRKKWAEEVKQLYAARDELLEIEHFTYSPKQERFGAGALTHAQVIEAASWLLTNRPTLQRVLVDRHPVVFIDESQDTSKRVLHALLALQRASKLCLGLIGDHRQRIYMDGEQTLPQLIPDDWARPMLMLNRRCPHRVVQLINAVWMADIEGRTEAPVGGLQYALSTRPVGTVRLYVGESTDPDKPLGERRCAEDMARRGGGNGWLQHDVGYNLLVLEHQLAAERGGFGNLYRALHRYDENRAKSGDISALSVFQKVLLPLSEAVLPDRTPDAWREHEVVVAHARDLVPADLAEQGAAAQRDAFARVRNGVRRLRELWNAGDPTLADLLRNGDETRLFALDPRLSDALATEPPTEKLTNKTPKVEVLASALHQPWSAYRAYRRYVDGLGTQGTHQGVKGSEFERVLVVIDDGAATGHSFAYERVFGAKPPTATDPEDEEAAKETSIDRTLRLLYVTCSRAKESLAVVVWTSAPDAVRKHVVDMGWFLPEEVQTVPSGPSS
jgi:DNA helicase-2/ATP-dependent DNA helicase PcrA